MNTLPARYQDVFILVARILLMALFITSGWSKLVGFQDAVGYMESLGVPMPAMAAVVAITVELFVGVALLLGLWPRPLALLMALFVLGTSFIGHPFWTMEGADRAMNMTHFYKNLSIIGGLLLLAVTGAGRFALGRHPAEP